MKPVFKFKFITLRIFITVVNGSTLLKWFFWVCAPDGWSISYACVNITYDLPTLFFFFTAPAVTHHITYINKSEMCCVGALGWLSELKNHLQALLICCRMFLFAPRLLPSCTVYLLPQLRVAAVTSSGKHTILMLMSKTSGQKQTTQTPIRRALLLVGHHK